MWIQRWLKTKNKPGLRKRSIHKTCTQFHSMNQVTCPLWSKNSTIYQRNAENKGMDSNDTQTPLKYTARDMPTNNKTKLQSAKEDKTHIKWKANPTPPQRNYAPKLKCRRKIFKYRPHYLTNSTTIHAQSVLTSGTRGKSIQQSLLEAAFEL
jgi:hypothetical protein